MNGIDEPEHGAARVGIRRDASRGDLLAIREHDAGCGSVVDDDLLNLGVDPNFSAGVPGRARQRLAHSTNSAASGPPRNRVAFSGREPEEDRRAARRSGTDKGAEHTARGDRCAQRFAFEPFVREIGDRHRQPPQQPVRVGLAKRSELPSGREKVEEVRGGHAVD